MPRTINNHLAEISDSMSKTVKNGKVGNTNEDW